MENTNLKRSVMPHRGFLTTMAMGHAGKMKIIGYNFAKLVRIGGFASMFTRGTVFYLDYHIFVPHMIYALLFFCAVFIVTFVYDAEEFAQKTLPHIETMVNDVKSFCPFLFGLFVSLTLSRWWAIRTMAVGFLQTHIINISALLVGYGGRVFKCEEDFDLFVRNHNKLVGYGLASLSCVAKESRVDSKNDSGLAQHDLVKLGFLTQQEMDILDPCGNKATVLWCWMCGLGGEILEMMQIPPPNFNNFYTELRLGMEGISKLHEYLGTQLPFPYVHMITLMINVNNMLMALHAGFRCGVAWDREHMDACAVEMLQMMLVPLLYQGLLQVCVMLGDPLGEDIIDFPILEFQLSIHEACGSMIEASRKFALLREDVGLGPLPNALSVKQLNLPGKMRVSTSVAPPPRSAPSAPSVKPATLGSASSTSAASSTMSPVAHNEILEHIEKGFDDLYAKQQGFAGPITAGSLVQPSHAEFLDRIDRKFEELKQRISVARPNIQPRALQPEFREPSWPPVVPLMADPIVGLRERSYHATVPQISLQPEQRSPPKDANALDCCSFRMSAGGETVKQSTPTPVVSIHATERLAHVVVEEKMGASEVH